MRATAALGDEAARAGLSLKVFQEWKAVAEDTRIPLDAMVDTFKELNIRADEFATTGKGSAAEAFARLGMSQDEVQRRLKDPSDLMLELIERTKALNDTAAATRIFDELFGGTGAEQAVRLLQLADGEIRKIIDSAHASGRVLDEEIVQRADEMDRRWSAAWRNFEANAKSAVLGAVMVLEDLRDVFGDLGNHEFFRWLVGEMDSAGLIDQTMFAGLAGEIARAEEELTSLERHLKILQQTAEKNTEFGFDNTEANAAIEETARRVAELQAQIRAMNAEAERAYLAGTPADPNALAGEATAAGLRAVSTPGTPSTPEAPGADTPPAAGRGRGSGASRNLEREREMLERRLEMIQEFIIREAEMTSVANDLAIERATKHHETQLQTLAQSLEGGLITRERYNDMVEALEEQHEAELTRIKQENIEARTQAEQQYLQMRQDAAHGIVNLLGMVGQKSRGAAIAAIALNKALMIAQTIQNTAAAAVAAVSLPPLGLGPVAGLPLAAKIKAFGALQVATIAGTGLMQAAGTGGGSTPSASGSGGGVGGTSGVSAPAQPQQAVTINLQGDVYSRQSVEDLIEEINKATADGYKLIIN